MIALFLTLILVGIFLLFYLRDPRRLLNGFLFIVAASALGLTADYYALKSGNVILGFLAYGITFLIVIIIALSSILLIAACFWNFYVLVKKEGLRPRNFLILLFGLFLLGANIMSYLDKQNIITGNATLVISLANVLILYLELSAMIFLMSSFLCNWYHPRHNKDYIVVLGAGLINGESVSKLLANRIDIAINFYNKQKKKTGTTPKLVLSGGQGSDEKISEALAMQVYALSKGIPPEDTLLEERSTNTNENMRFSKEVIQKESREGAYKAVYATNNFHLLRAGIYARRQHFDAYGISAKTAFYYWPNATLREFAGTFVLYKKWHITLISLVIVLNTALWFVNKYFVIK